MKGNKHVLGAVLHEFIKFTKTMAEKVKKELYSENGSLGRLWRKKDEKWLLFWTASKYQFLAFLSFSKSAFFHPNFPVQFTEDAF